MRSRSHALVAPFLAGCIVALAWPGGAHAAWQQTNIGPPADVVAANAAGGAVLVSSGHPGQIVISRPGGPVQVTTPSNAIAYGAAASVSAGGVVTVGSRTDSGLEVRLGALDRPFPSRTVMIADISSGDGLLRAAAQTVVALSDGGALALGGRSARITSNGIVVALVARFATIIAAREVADGTVAVVHAEVSLDQSRASMYVTRLSSLGVALRTQGLGPVATSDGVGIGYLRATGTIDQAGTAVAVWGSSRLRRHQVSNLADHWAWAAADERAGGGDYHGRIPADLDLAADDTLVARYTAYSPLDRGPRGIAAGPLAAGIPTSIVGFAGVLGVQPDGAAAIAVDEGLAVRPAGHTGCFGQPEPLPAGLTGTPQKLVFGTQATTIVAATPAGTTMLLTRPTPMPPAAPPQPSFCLDTASGRLSGSELLTVDDGAWWPLGAENLPTPRGAHKLLAGSAMMVRPVVSPPHAGTRLAVADVTCARARCDIALRIRTRGRCRRVERFSLRRLERRTIRVPTTVSDRRDTFIFRVAALEFRVLAAGARTVDRVRVTTDEQIGTTPTVSCSRAAT